MASESQVMLDIDGPRVQIVRDNVASNSRRWKACGAVLMVALCVAAAAVCFSLQTRSRSDESNDIRHTLRQLSQTAKAAIHLTGKKNLKDFKKSVQWIENQDQAFNDGFKLEKNEIIIPHTGIYFVYSQASYRLNCHSDSEEDEDQILTMTHMVSRYSTAYNKWKPLLNSVRSACKIMIGEEENFFNTIYLGAAFKLQAGDRLRTEMGKSLLPNVEDENGKTFFGVFTL